jgi:nitroimidazol reductase NimA-like FMN-containing flavoprotein (pyridoxamine 5'-phosphate oxidase superfamily)
LAADPRLVTLDRDECLMLLQLETVGRVAVASGRNAPVMIPVSFLMNGESPVFRTEEPSVVSALGGGVISLQVDRFDWYRHTGWSVLVTGTAEEVSEVEAWALDDRLRAVRIRVGQIAGRRIELDPAPVEAGGYQ